MSTRSTTHFIHQKDNVTPIMSYYPPESTTCAIVYRHYDGYPEAMTQDLKTFFTIMQDARSSHFMDAEYLASHWLVYLARMYTEVARRSFDQNAKPFDFSGIGITQKDPGDIEYRYVVNCSIMASSGLPLVAVQFYGDNGWNNSVDWRDPDEWLLDPGTIEQISY